jgi:hypothetical protein
VSTLKMVIRGHSAVMSITPWEPRKIYLSTIKVVEISITFPDKLPVSKLPKSNIAPVNYGRGIVESSTNLHLIKLSTFILCYCQVTYW